MIAQEVAEFKIGDQVTWSSQSNGTVSTKIGQVVLNVEEALRLIPRQPKIARNPMRAVEVIFPDHRRLFDGHDWPAGRVVVEVQSSDGKGKKLLYMPRLSGLQKTIE
ncbi:hypothetical protein ACYSUW_13515 [Pseudomonas frederiksbergensis]